MNGENLRRVLKDPKLIAHRLYRDFYRKVIKNKGIDIMDKDWDNLLILDACRYDLFSKVCTIDGELTNVISSGSHTTEFLRQTFQGRQFNDTVYISATPQLEWTGLTSTFYDVIQVWETGWDDKLGTVPPNEVCKAARAAASEYPHKRLIIHFVQPHFPFIGPTGKWLQKEMSIRSGIDGANATLPSVWDSLEEGNISEDIVWDAYGENLEIVLDHVKGLIDELDGKTVLTSDHGNALGEYGLYGHPGQKAIKSLIYVPWLEIENGARRRIVAEAPTNSRSKMDQSELEQKLSDLGYK